MTITINPIFVLEALALLSTKQKWHAMSDLLDMNWRETKKTNYWPKYRVIPSKLCVLSDLLSTQYT